MRIEFFVPAPNCFTHEIYFREEGKQEMYSIDQLDSNSLSIIYHKIINHPITLKTVKYLQSRKITDKIEVIRRVIIKHFPKLNHTWDIDDDKLNIEC